MRQYQGVLLLASLLATLALGSALRSSPTSKYCANIKVGGASYDLSWWVNKGPFSKSDATGQYTWTFAPCSSLDAPCPDNSDGGQTSACSTPNSAVSCEAWPNTQNPAKPFTACTASAAAIPTFAPYSSGTDNGIVMTVGGGDDCGVCAPSTRATAFTIICDNNMTPNIVAAVNADLPSPVYNIQIRHCSGCLTSDPKFCGGAPQPNVAQLLVDFQFIGGNNSVLSLFPPPNEIKVSTQTGADLTLDGSINNALNNTVSVLVNTGGSFGKGTLSFLPQNMLALSFVDVVSGKSYSCGSGKAPRSKFVSMACTYGTNGVLVLSGSIQ